MAHSNTWNAAYEALPADANNASGGAGKIRGTRLDIRERIAKDHYMAIAGTDADHGEHSKVTFNAPLGSKPTYTANKGFLYTKNVSTKVELFWLDEDDNEIQLTVGGAWNQRDIPSGTILLFESNTAISGYTLKTDKDDMAVYITKGSGASGETGATDKSGGSWAIDGLTNAGTTLTAAQSGLPAHLHTYRSFEGSDGGMHRGGNDEGSTANTSTVSAANAASSHTHTSSSDSTWRPPGRNFTRQQRN